MDLSDYSDSVGDKARVNREKGGEREVGKVCRVHEILEKPRTLSTKKATNCVTPRGKQFLAKQSFSRKRWHLTDVYIIQINVCYTSE